MKERTEVGQERDLLLITVVADNLTKRRRRMTQVGHPHYHPLTVLFPLTLVLSLRDMKEDILPAPTVRLHLQSQGQSTGEGVERDKGKLKIKTIISWSGIPMIEVPWFNREHHEQVTFIKGPIWEVFNRIKSSD